MSMPNNKPSIKTISQKYYLLIQERWAKKMSSLTLGLSKRSLVFWWFGFVAFSGGLSIAIVYSSFTKEATNQINITAVSKPKKVNEKLQNQSLETFSLSEKEYKKIRVFISYMDSLEKSPSGKKTYDSIKLFRPGLLDSLVFIENYYKSNVKE